jgi:hypothetical protein
LARQNDHYKLKGFGKYAYLNLDRGGELDELSEFGQNRVNSHGFNGSIIYDLNRYWGVKFDLSLHSHGEDLQSTLNTILPLPDPTVQTFKCSQNDQQYLGGIQFKDNKNDGPKIKPIRTRSFRIGRPAFFDRPGNLHLYWQCAQAR